MVMRDYSAMQNAYGGVSEQMLKNAVQQAQSSLVGSINKPRGALAQHREALNEVAAKLSQIQGRLSTLGDRVFGYHSEPVEDSYAENSAVKAEDEMAQMGCVIDRLLTLANSFNESTSRLEALA